MGRRVGLDGGGAENLPPPTRTIRINPALVFHPFLIPIMSLANLHHFLIYSLPFPVRHPLAGYVLLRQFLTYLWKYF